jgi:hypothetical protein
MEEHFQRLTLRVAIIAVAGESIMLCDDPFEEVISDIVGIGGVGRVGGVGDGGVGPLDRRERGDVLSVALGVQHATLLTRRNYSLPFVPSSDV